MTLKILPDLVQGSEEWLEQRRGMVTASMVGRLITAKTLKPASNPESRGLTALLVAERITGHVEDTYTSPDMWRGIELEPVARDLYSEHYAPATECGFMVLDDGGRRIGWSPDGLVGDVGGIEIKCPRPKNHLETILTGEVPTHYMPQLQCGLYVSGRGWIDFVSLSPGLPLFVKRIYPDQRWFNAIDEAVDAFEDAARLMIADFEKKVEGLVPTERQDLEIKI